MASSSQLSPASSGEPAFTPESVLFAVAPAVPTPREEILAALRTVPVLEGLTEEEYAWLADHSRERKGQDGALIFRENEPACEMNIILSGEVHVRRRHSGPMALFIGRAGQVSGKLPFSRMKSYGGDGSAVGEVWGLDIHEDHFPEMLAAIPSMGQRSVSLLLDRVRLVTRMELQAEKISALGKLAANLSHELNNPASAAQRSAAGLSRDLRDYGEQVFYLGVLSTTHHFSGELKEWVERTRARIRAYAPQSSRNASPLQLTDREDAVTRWLEQHCINEPWSIAPALAESSISFDELDEVARIAPCTVLPLFLASFANSLRVERMTEAVLESTNRIFDLITAIKDYSYMDQAPVQDVDLAQSLLTTVAMLQSQMQNVKVETDFDPDLPPISAYGSELSQVWTALIENALEAMKGQGTLRLVTRLTGSLAMVEIWDDGPGIAPAIQSRIFEPFFTTKPPGGGLGLGLDTAARIVGRHSGFLTVESRPGATCFQVRVPLDRADAY